MQTDTHTRTQRHTEIYTRGHTHRDNTHGHTHKYTYTHGHNTHTQVDTHTHSLSLSVLIQLAEGPGALSPVWVSKSPEEQPIPGPAQGKSLEHADPESTEALINMRGRVRRAGATERGAHLPSLEQSEHQSGSRQEWTTEP